MSKRVQLIVLLVVALVVAAAVPVAAGNDAAGDDDRSGSRLVVRVFYRTPEGKAPLAGVQVFALVDGVQRHKCTNARGRVAFGGLADGATVSILAAGPATSDECDNSEFLNPETGDQMLAVFHRNHHGVREFDPFELEGARTAVRMVAKTPKSQLRVCFGNKVTILGTRGDDNPLVGTMENDVINARGGHDVILAGGGSDIVCAGPGNDAVYGEDGGDWLFGENGADSIFGGGVGLGDVAHGGNGEDHCEGADTYISCEV